MDLRRVALAVLTVGFAANPAVAAPPLPGTGPDAGHTVVYRDTWGVPHLYAPSVEAGLYAQGWAQAQDRPHELLQNFLRALGESASVEGPAAVPFDWVARTWDHIGTARRHADRIRPEVREHIRAFARGIRDYYAAHPEDVPEWWGNREIDEYLVIAFGRLFLYAWSIEQAFADLQRVGIEPGAGEYHHGSNQWAVAPSRSAEGAAILLIDPHLSWWGLSRFWEFRVHAGDWHGSGFTLPGSPYIGLGHTDHLAWAMTTGGPSTTCPRSCGASSWPTFSRLRRVRGVASAARYPQEIRFRDVLAAVDAYPTSDRCAFGWGDCNAAKSCPLHGSWSRLSDAVRDWAASTTLADARNAVATSER